MPQLKARLRKWYKIEAVTFTCPYCQYEHDVEEDVGVRTMPTSIDEKYICDNCTSEFGFSDEDYDYV